MVQVGRSMMTVLAEALLVWVEVAANAVMEEALSHPPQAFE